MFALRAFWFVETTTGAVVAGKRFQSAELRAQQYARASAVNHDEVGRSTAAAPFAPLSLVSDADVALQVLASFASPTAALDRAPGGGVTLECGVGPFFVHHVADAAVMGKHQLQQVLGQVADLADDLHDAAVAAGGPSTRGTSANSSFAGTGDNAPGDRLSRASAFFSRASVAAFSHGSAAGGSGSGPAVSNHSMGGPLAGELLRHSLAPALLSPSGDGDGAVGRLLIIVLPLCVPLKVLEADRTTFSQPSVTGALELARSTLSPLAARCCLVRGDDLDALGPEAQRLLTRLLEAAGFRLVQREAWVRMVHFFTATTLPFGSETTQSARAEHLGPQLLTRLERQQRQRQRGRSNSEHETLMTIADASEGSRGASLRGSTTAVATAASADGAGGAYSIRIAMVEEIAAVISSSACAAGQEHAYAVTVSVVAQPASTPPPIVRSMDVNDFLRQVTGAPPAADVTTLMLVGAPDRAAALVLPDRLRASATEAVIGVSLSKRASLFSGGSWEHGRIRGLLEALGRSIYNRRAAAAEAGSPARCAASDLGLRSGGAAATPVSSPTSRGAGGGGSVGGGGGGDSGSGSGGGGGGSVSVAVVEVHGLHRWALLHAFNEHEFAGSVAGTPFEAHIPTPTATLAKLSVEWSRQSPGVVAPLFPGAFRAVPVHPRVLARCPRAGANAAALAEEGRSGDPFVPPMNPAVLKEALASIDEDTFGQMTELLRLPGFILMQVEMTFFLNLSTADDSQQSPSGSGGGGGGGHFTVPRAEVPLLEARFNFRDGVRVCAHSFATGKESLGSDVAVDRETRDAEAGGAASLVWRIPSVKARKHGTTFEACGFVMCDVSSKGMSRGLRGVSSPSALGLGAASELGHASADPAVQNDGGAGATVALAERLTHADARTFASAVAAEGLMPNAFASLAFCVLAPQSPQGQCVLVDTAALQEHIVEADGNAMHGLHSGASPPRERLGRDDVILPVSIGCQPYALRGVPGASCGGPPHPERAVTLRSHPEYGYIFLNAAANVRQR